MLRRLVRGLPGWAMPPIRAAYCRYKGWGDRRFAAATGVSFLPPADLRFHVGSVNREDYLRIGRLCAEDVQKALLTENVDWASLENVLDFGCGSGRTLVWLEDSGPRLWGADLHEGCIQWCRKTLPQASFLHNGVDPPLEVEDEAFDLVFSLSVFTHLDEDGQFAWLEELRRMVRPGGYLLLSTHGPHCWKGLSVEEVAVLEQRGILVKEAHGLWGTFRRYFNTYHSEAYLRERWGEVLQFRSYLPRGLGEYQDLVLLRRERKTNPVS